MALSFFISLFVTYTDIANRQTTNIFFGFLGIHSSDAQKKKEKEEEEKKSFFYDCVAVGVFVITMLGAEVKGDVPDPAL